MSSYWLYHTKHDRIWVSRLLTESKETTCFPIKFAFETLGLLIHVHTSIVILVPTPHIHRFSWAPQSAKWHWPKGLLLHPHRHPLGPVKATPLIGVVSVHSVGSLLPIYSQEHTTSSNYDLHFRIMLDEKPTWGNMQWLLHAESPSQEPAGLTRLFLLQLDDCTLQLSHNGTYLDLEATLAEQRDELEGFQDDAG